MNSIPSTGHPVPEIEIPGFCRPFHLSQRLAYDPCQTCVPGVLLAQIARRDLSTRAPGLPPTGQTELRPGIPILPSTSLVLLDQQLAYRPLLPLRVSRPWCRRQLLAFSLAAILSSGLKTAVSCPMTVAVATVSFRVDFIFVPDTTVAASFAKPLSPCPVWLAPFRFCQVPSLLAVAGQCHRVPALTHVADYWRLPPRCGLGELA